MNPSSFLSWRWKQVTVHLHWSLLIWLPWYYFQMRGVVSMIECVLATVLILVAHEAGHGLMARWRGLSVYALRVYFLLGRCEHAPPRSERDEIHIAWGGVLAQAVLLVSAVLLQAILQVMAPDAALALAPAFTTLVWTNALWIAFSLLPVPALDGHTAWRIVPLWLGHRWPPLVRWLRNWRWPGVGYFRRRRAEKVSSKVTYELMERLRQNRKRTDSETDKR